MRLIGFAVVLALSLTLAPLATKAQQAAKTPPGRLSLSHECSGFRGRLPPEVARAWLRGRSEHRY